ncbi:MAG: hypothetical protein VYA60_09310 [Pseudomonadota bacterium]|nr:hypothetical protein [Pseudomonadota bacterium]|tara:strand:- start:25977 stop:26441 length:465 start_codon:yes stop_codon:yes gene_type:complete
MKKPTTKKVWLMRIGCALGWLVAIAVWMFLTISHAKADTAISESLPFLTPSMLIATVIGAVGSFLAFGEDKKFPPSAASLGHILLGFGAGLFFTRGSLELMGYIDSSDDVVLLVSFLWAGIGYFFLRLVVAVVKSEQIAEILPAWAARLLGVSK